MEELYRKHAKAIANSTSTQFSLSDFHYLDVFHKYLPKVGIPESWTDSVIRSIIEDYSRTKGYYCINDGMVSLTSLGLSEWFKQLNMMEREE